MESFEIDSLWSESYGDSRIRVAILDGSVDCSHPSLATASLAELDGLACMASSEGSASQHGTHVASVIFGQHGSPILGIAPNCQGILIPIFRDGQDGSLIASSQTDLAFAITRAVEQGVHIINISAGELSHTGMAEPMLVEAVRKCVSAGILIVAATGNQGCDCLNIPGALPSVLAVGAMDKDGIPMKSSNWGEAYQNHGILAYGDHVIGAKAGGGSIVGSGTSYATAIVSGVVALLLSIQLKYGQSPDPLFIRQVLLETALKDDRDSRRLLAGRLNAEGALLQLKQRLSPPSSKLSSLPDSLSAFEGPYLPAPWALREKYKGVLGEKFGTVDIQLQNGDSYNIPDFHYFLGKQKLGMRLIPVSDDGDVTAPNGSQAPGHHVIDHLLRKESGLSADEPIYAIISYTRPDEHSIPFAHLTSTRKLQLGHQHLAAYVGEGHTTHVLERFSNPAWKPKGSNVIWNVKGYPANVFLISLQGVEQHTLNRNALIVDTILVSGAYSPVNTQNLQCRTKDINTILQFYRDWIRDADYLKDLSWYTNCSNHKSIVVNVMLNVPHSEKRFQQIFGDEGPQLWHTFKARYAQITNREFTKTDETEFTPLWQLEGLSAEDVQPLTLADYNLFQAAMLENRLDSYQGRRPVKPGAGMAWKPETLADLINGFMVMYFSFPIVGGVYPALMLLNLQGQVKDVLNISEEQYRALVDPVIKKLILADAMAHVQNNSLWLRQVTNELYAGLGGNTEDLSLTGTPDASIMNQLETYISDARENIDEIMSRSQKTIHEVAEWLQQSLSVVIERARGLAVLDESKAGFFTSPGVIQRIALGMYEASPYVAIRTVCTAMDEEELVLRSSSASAKGEDCFDNMNRNPASETNRKAVHPLQPSGSNLKQHKIRPMATDQSFMNDKLDIETPTQAIHSSLAHEAFEVVPSGTSSPTCSCEGVGGMIQLVYALGKLDFDLVSQSRRDSIKQTMGESVNPENPEQLLEYLNSNPWDASAIQWTLNIESTPIYVLQPQGAFADKAYTLLRQFFQEQITEGVERVSIPGQISGSAKLRNGHTVPLLVPDIRGMYSWTTASLVSALAGEPSAAATPESQEKFKSVQAGVSNFLDRVYYEIRNPGLAPQERAMNYAATNAFDIAQTYEAAIREEMELDSIEVERSPICRPGSDCWDVKLFFFYPQRQVQTVRKVYRLTVDVTDLVPATVGEVRSWFIR